MLRTFEMRDYICLEKVNREHFPTKEDLKRKAAGGPGPSEKRRQIIRKKRKK